MIVGAGRRDLRLGRVAPGLVRPGRRQIARRAVRRRAETGDARRHSRCRPAGRAPGPRRAGSAPPRAPAFMTRAPTPCGPPSLCADRVRLSASSVRMSTGDLARRLDRVDVQPAAGAAHQRRRLGDRLDHAALVVGMMDGDHGPAAVWPAAAPARPGRPRRSRRPAGSRPARPTRRRLGHARMLASR